VGYAVKKAGTSCFMIPETFAFIAGLTAQAHALGIEVLVEVHGHYEDQMAIASRVDWVYDFALPPLVLQTLFSRTTAHLKRWLAIRPVNAVIVLDTHDGIGVTDVDTDRRRGRAQGLLPRPQIDAVVDTIHVRSSGESRLASGDAASNLDADQINCTFFDAVGKREAEYLIARAIQCCVPGVPQVYYVGLLAGSNDMDLLRRTGNGRDINRHYYTATEVEQALQRPVVQSLLALLRLRNTHPAFSGTFHLLPSADDALALEWTASAGFARLEVNLTQMSASLTCSADSPAGIQVWHAATEA
jgi:sucrose phosphorylase